MLTRLARLVSQIIFSIPVTKFLKVQELRSVKTNTCRPALVIDRIPSSITSVKVNLLVSVNKVRTVCVRLTVSVSVRLSK